LGRRDGNEALIIEGLRRCACDVYHLNWPADLIVGVAGRNYLLEVKDPEQPPNKRRLTPVEQDFHDNWRGQVAVVETLEEALEAVGLRRRT
jgi:hypothetical protein